MTENIVIPYNTRCNEEIYKKYRERIQWMTRTLHRRLSIKQLEDLARSQIIDNLVSHNSYQCYYTLNQINHLAELFANAIQKNQKTLYIY